MSNVLFTSVRNEGPFLVEWVTYHRMIGFDRIVVAYNDCTDGTDLLLIELQKQGLVEAFENQVEGDLPPQICAEMRARANGAFQVDDYVMWLDLDEFLVPPAHLPSVSNLTLEMERREADALLLNWRIMGDSGYAGLPHGFIIDQFTWGARAQFRLNRPVKSLFRYSQFIERLHLHRPVWRAEANDEIRLIDGAGFELEPEYHTKLFKDGSPKSGVIPKKNMWSLGKINHYSVRTKLLFALKKARGVGYFGSNGTHLNRYNDEFYERFNQNARQDFGILRYRDALLYEYAALMRLPAISAAHSECVTRTLGEIPTQARAAA